MHLILTATTFIAFLNIELAIAMHKIARKQFCTAAGMHMRGLDSPILIFESEQFLKRLLKLYGNCWRNGVLKAKLRLAVDAETREELRNSEGRGENN